MPAFTVPFFVLARYAGPEDLDLVGAELGFTIRQPGALDNGGRVTVEDEPKYLAIRRVTQKKQSLHAGTAWGVFILDFDTRSVRWRGSEIRHPLLSYAARNQIQIVIPPSFRLLVPLQLQSRGRHRFEHAFLEAYRAQTDRHGQSIELVDTRPRPGPHPAARHSAWLADKRRSSSNFCVLEALDAYQFATTPLQRRILNLQAQYWDEEFGRHEFGTYQLESGQLWSGPLDVGDPDNDVVQMARLQPSAPDSTRQSEEPDEPEALPALVPASRRLYERGEKRFDEVCQTFLQRHVQPSTAEGKRILASSVEQLWAHLDDAPRFLFQLEANLPGGATDDQYDELAFGRFLAMRVCPEERLVSLLPEALPSPLAREAPVPAIPSEAAVTAARERLRREITALCRELRARFR
jgi:hypothetical protein